MVKLNLLELLLLLAEQLALLLEQGGLSARIPLPRVLFILDIILGGSTLIVELLVGARVLVFNHHVLALLLQG